MVKQVASRTADLKRLFGTDQPVALVTGSGADRVGRVIARKLGEAGYRVVLHANRSIQAARDVCHAWKAEGISASVVQGAVEDESAVRGWVETIIQEQGGLHAVVNAAAVWESTKLEDLDEAKLLGQWRSNLLGPALLCKHAGLAMAKQSHGGVIINLGDAALGRPYVDFSAYLLSKSGVRTLTEVMAVELAHRNPKVRVNCVLPGPVMLDPSIGQSEREQIRAQALLKCEGDAQDVATAVVFLMESPFVTGVSIPVDGGRTIYAGCSGEPLAHPTYGKSF